MYKNTDTVDEKTEKIINYGINKGVKEKKVNKKVNYKSEYLPRIYEELETYIHNDAVDFLLLDSDIKDYARSNGVFCGYSRGSVSGSLIAYLIGMTDVDSVKFNMNFQRFMNKERISLADVDSDWEPNQRDFIKKHIYEMHGVYCADIITFNTIALKGAVKDVARALGYSVDIADQINKQIDTNEREMRNQYPDIFEYVDIINGTIVSIGSHPCGTVVSPIPLDENMGLCSLSTNENPITMLNMKEIDSLNYVKLDILGLDNIEIINETCKMAGIERLTPDNIVDDEKVWLDIRENTAFIFQWESDSAQAYLKQLFSDETVNKIKKLNPNFKYIDLFSVGNGAIRPAGQSYREELAKGVFHDNGHEALNSFMSPTLGYCVYQEQIINFLNQFCGFTMGEGDVVRKGFAKKLGTEQFIPRIKSGFIQTMKEKYNVTEEESEQLIVSFLKVIEDASSYLFSLNHS
jgi:DNA polymerase III subunit alpha